MNSHPDAKSTDKRLKRWPWFATIAVTAAAVAAAGYLFDREQGRGRRLRLAASASHIARGFSRRLGRKVAYMRRSAHLRRLHLEHGFPPKAVDGLTLLDRVESELFTDPRIPHGRLSLEVEGSVIVLRGALVSAADIDVVDRAVRRIPGVEDVRNLLHLTGTPAPNKVAALRASSRALQYGGWPPEPPPDVDSQIALA
jgi:hypothetical protein